MLQEENGLPQQLTIVMQTGQTIALADEANRPLRKVECDPDEQVCRVRPAGPASPVVIDPLHRFGQPSISGVATFESGM